jgi:hypothetical protein
LGPVTGSFRFGVAALVCTAGTARGVGPATLSALRGSLSAGSLAAGAEAGLDGWGPPVAGKVEVVLEYWKVLGRSRS